MEKDIYNYDYITLSIRPDREEEVLREYKCFAWEPYERKRRGKKYVLVVLRRPHNIPDKDRLQLLQINMEKAQDDVIKYSRHKHTFIKVFAIYLWGFGLISILFGLSVAANGQNAAVIIIGTLFAMLGLAVIILTGAFFKKLIRSEIRNFEARTEIAAEDMAAALKEAEKITNG